jgi:hypothetical protein
MYAVISGMLVASVAVRANSVNTRTPCPSRVRAAISATSSVEVAAGNSSTSLVCIHVILELGVQAWSAPMGWSSPRMRPNLPGGVFSALSLSDMGEEAPGVLPTSVGLDVHARSVVAAAIDGQTREVCEGAAPPSHTEVLEWIGKLPGPCAVV